MSDNHQHRDLAKETFDWKGKAGEEFAKWNPTDPEGVDKKHVGFFGITATAFMGRAVDAMAKDGMDIQNTKGII
jgi:hypothetical protein